MSVERGRWRIGMAVLLVSTLLVGCELLESAPTYERVAGTYDAVTFTVAGPADGQVDVLDQGGSLVMTLEEDGTVEGHIAWLPPADTTFSARFTTRRDTVYLHETHLLVNQKFVWDEEAGTLTAPEGEGWMALYHLVLLKRDE